MKIETNGQRGFSYILDSQSLIIMKKKKEIYNGPINNIIILHFNERKIRKNTVLDLILLLPNHTNSFLDMFMFDNIASAYKIIDKLREYCEFYDLSYFKASMFTRPKSTIKIQKDAISQSNEKDIFPESAAKTESMSENNTKPKILEQETRLTSHEKKRNAVIKKIEQGFLLFDISHGVIQDGMHKSLPLVKEHNIVMKKGEKCHYYGKVKITKSKNVVVGNIRNSYGMSSRVSKGHYARFGQSKSQNIRSDIVEETPAMLCITNQRIILTSSKYGFDKSLSKLTGIIPHFDRITLQFDDKVFNLLTRYPILITEIISVAIANT